MKVRPTKIRTAVQKILASQGEHDAKMTHLIGIGTQKKQVNGIPTEVSNLAIGYEISDQIDPHTGCPMIVYHIYPMSMHPHARLRIDIEAARNSNFASQQAANDYELTELLGQICRVEIIHRNTSGRTEAAIKRVQAAQSDFDYPQSEREPLIFDPEQPDMSVYAKLPDWLKTRIQDSPEWEQIAQSTQDAA